MRALRIEDLKPGFRVAQALVDDSGRTLLNKGVELTESYINVIRSKGYTHLYVKDDEEVEVEPEEDLSPIVRSAAVRTLRKAFEDIGKELDDLRKVSVDDISKICSSDTVRVLMGEKGVLAGINDVVSQILDEVLTRNTLAGLTSLKNQDSQLYDHSIDVCVVAIMVGTAVHLSNVRMRQLATGCLLHDIGMAFLRKDLDEAHRIRHHTMLGYELLRQSHDPDIMAPHVAYEHHEHQDGSGQPRGLVGTNTLRRVRGSGRPVLTLISEIAAVANVYDNLLSGSLTRDPLPPDKALSEVSDLSGTMLNAEIVSWFRRVVPVYPRATQVILRGKPYNNFVGVVSEVDPLHMDRPVVLLVRDGQRKKIDVIRVETKEFPDMEIRSVGL